eukprot:gene8448-9350_t
MSRRDRKIFSDDSTSAGVDSTQSLLTTTAQSLLSNDFESTVMDSYTDSLFTSSSALETDSEIKVTKEMIDKKQLQHDLELLRIELSQKNLMIDTMKAEYLNKVDEMEDRHSDAVHQRQLVAVQYEKQLRLTKAEHSREVNSLKEEIQLLLKQQKETNFDNQKLMEKAIESKDMLTDLDLDEDDYLAVKGKNIEEQTLREFIALKFYEALKPLKIQCEVQQNQIDLYANSMKDGEEEVAKANKELDEERHARIETDARCQQFQIHIEELRDQLKRKDYKNENFDVLRSEKDQIERDFVEMRKKFTIANAELNMKSEENDSLRKQMTESSQSLHLLKQDKEYLGTQLSELKPRHNFLEQKLEETIKQLDDVRKSREDLYEKYINSRDQYKSEFEEKLRSEIEGLSRKTSVEIDKIKSNANEIYERENRALRESRDNALAAKERATMLVNDAENKYKEILSEFRNLQMSSENRAAELANEIRMKAFESQRLQLLYEETNKNLKKSNLEGEKLRKQNEALNKEYHALHMSSSRRLTELEAKDGELKNKLHIYEKMEEELDDVVMQAAEMTNDAEAERVLFSYGYGANVPSTAKRRMQQSVHLAKRVLQLERANSSLRHERESEDKKVEQLADELSRTTKMLNEAKQPYNYLVDSIKTRDDENKSMKDTIGTLNEDIRRLKGEKSALKKLNDQMTLDLERLLNQKEEVHVLKSVVMGLKSSTNSLPSYQHSKPSHLVKRKIATLHASDFSEPVNTDTLVSTPKPTVFVS